MSLSQLTLALPSSSRLSPPILSLPIALTLLSAPLTISRTLLHNHRHNGCPEPIGPHGLVCPQRLGRWTRRILAAEPADVALFALLVARLEAAD